MGYLSSPLEPLEIAKIVYFGQNLGVLRGGRSISPPQKISGILLALLQDIFGRFSNLTNLEPFHLDIAHIYRGISGQK